MSPFEYVSVLISIILGLGITQIVTGVADIIQNWRSTKLYLPHALWIVFVFFLHIQEWWVLYEMRTITTWKLPVFLFTILYPIGLFILARLLFLTPLTVKATTETDLKSFYFSNFKRYFGLAFMLTILSIVDNLLFNSYSLSEQPVQLLLLILFPVLILKEPKQPWMHTGLAILLLLLLLTSMALVDWVIRI